MQLENAVSVDHGLVYMAGSEKEALVFPRRVKDHSKTFAALKTCDGKFFTKPVGQEFDNLDPALHRYMKSNDRGV